MDRGTAPQDQLREALTECQRLREENARLRELLSQSVEVMDRPAVPPATARVFAPAAAPVSAPVIAPVPAAVTARSPVPAKIALFRGLFQARDDVFAVRWERQDGRSGYAPACRNEWERGLCAKPRVKCSECPNRSFLPLTDQVLRDHLAGAHTVGIYPLLSDESCWFLAVDFDKAAWQEDAAAFLDACGEMGVPAALERSRSGGGGHVWIFFDRAIPAIQARRLGSAILTLAMERRHQIGLDSYDRFFPNQDTLPKGGFGNLIALPLQRDPRRKGNSLFIDRDLEPYPDQWALLDGLRRVPSDKVETIVREASRTQTVFGVRASLAEDDDSPDPWLLPPSRGIPARPVPGPMPDRVRVVRGGLVYVEKEGLPPAMLDRLLRLAAFQNPEFHKAQAARLPTFGKPRVIGCGEDFPRHIGLPRGCFADALNLLRWHGIQVEVGDERFGGHPICVAFEGELTPEQQVAASAMMADDIGVLSAPTAFGKTIVGAWLIATRNVNTLVLVHRRQLLDQWRARLAAGLGLPPKSIGQIGAGKTRPTGVIDVGILQSLNRKGEVSDLVAGYGQVIVDECHHVSAFSFERVLKQVRARYVVGLTATPLRKDGHHPIIIMQCGPIRFRADEKRAAAARPFSHVVIPRATAFRIPGNGAEPGIQSFQEVYAALLADEARNDLIFQDLVRALADGRSPLLLTERTAHLEEFDRRLRAIGKNAIILRGGMGVKQREAVVGQLAAEGEERVVLATGRYAGEGFDDPRLDTLFLAMPIAWRGTLQQYVGRIHRANANKRVVQVYDYVDHDVPVLRRMYAKRLKGYAALGYTIQPSGALAKQLSLL